MAKRNNAMEKYLRFTKKFVAAYDSAVERLKADRALPVSISDGNDKMGAVASVSLLPLVTCPGRCAHTCGAKCYAAKIANMRPSVLAAYARNTAMAIHCPDLFWAAVRVAMAGVRWFRFHVSGDILNADYLQRMIDAVAAAPWCQVLVFTKRYSLVNDWIAAHGGTRAALPANLHLLFSAWPGLEMDNRYNFPVAAVVMRGQDPDPAWLVCGGNCFDCACRGVGCWVLQAGQVVCFREH